MFKLNPSKYKQNVVSMQKTIYNLQVLAMEKTQRYQNYMSQIEKLKNKSSSEDSFVGANDIEEVNSEINSEINSEVNSKIHPIDNAIISTKSNDVKTPTLDASQKPPNKKKFNMDKINNIIETTDKTNFFSNCIEKILISKLLGTKKNGIEKLLGINKQNDEKILGLDKAIIEKLLGANGGVNEKIFGVDKIIIEKLLKLVKGDKKSVIKNIIIDLLNDDD